MVWSPRYIDALILRDRDADADPQTGELGKSASGLEERVFYLADANYNVTALLDTNGNVLERYAYDPYGKVTYLDADFAELAQQQSAYSNTTLYTGRELDPATGLYYYRARYYHPHLGRFLTRDPLSYSAGDENLYRYLSSRPLMLSDPLGKAGGAAVAGASALPVVLEWGWRVASAVSTVITFWELARSPANVTFLELTGYDYALGTDNLAAPAVSFDIRRLVARSGKDFPVQIGPRGWKLLWDYAEFWLEVELAEGDTLSPDETLGSYTSKRSRVSRAEIERANYHIMPRVAPANVTLQACDGWVSTTITATWPDGTKYEASDLCGDVEVYIKWSLWMQVYDDYSCLDPIYGYRDGVLCGYHVEIHGTHGEWQKLLTIDVASNQVA